MLAAECELLWIVIKKVLGNGDLIAENSSTAPYWLDYTDTHL